MDKTNIYRLVFTADKVNVYDLWPCVNRIKICRIWICSWQTKCLCSVTKCEWNKCLQNRFYQWQSKCLWSLTKCEWNQDLQIWMLYVFHYNKVYVCAKQFPIVFTTYLFANETYLYTKNISDTVKKHVWKLAGI